MPKPLPDLRVEDFEPLSGETFTLAAGEHELGLKLATVQRLGAALRDGGAFSLIFTAAAGRSLPQATYALTHAAIGTFALFMVPLAPEGGQNRYEVIFT